MKELRLAYETLIKRMASDKFQEGDEKAAEAEYEP